MDERKIGEATADALIRKVTEIAIALVVVHSLIIAPLALIGVIPLALVVWIICWIMAPEPYVAPRPPPPPFVDTRPARERTLDNVVCWGLFASPLLIVTLGWLISMMAG